MGPNRNWKRAEELFDKLMHPSLGRFDLEDFKQKLFSTKTMLYIADNAGEIVGDKILLSILKKNIFFLLQIKCPLVGKELKSTEGEILLTSISQI